MKGSPVECQAFELPDREDKSRPIRTNQVSGIVNHLQFPTFASLEELHRHKYDVGR